MKLIVHHTASRYLDARRRYGITYDEVAAKEAIEAAKR